MALEVKSVGVIESGGSQSEIRSCASHLGREDRSTLHEWQYVAIGCMNEQCQAIFDHGIFNGIRKVSRRKITSNQRVVIAVYY